ncbi:MAG: mycofactocin system FadH/OYE family oxidoreductase 2 [Rhodococcus sp.]|nr:mycofactocin system FadH/OYE family oxidoreductase 2 [Rhodococcus sp. (in: high G+C Gram-positive bacteria)]
MTEYPHLFTRLRVGPLTLRNRVIFCAHLTNYAQSGRPTDRHIDYYRARAAGGAGMIVTEEHTVHRSDHPYEKMIHGYEPSVIPAYRALTDAVHAEGAKILAQLNHNGNQSSGMYSRSPVWAPSAVPDPMFREVPKAIDEMEIRELIDGYARTATHCRAGGFDGVEIQASQASIMRAFLARATNRRADEYGGALHNRARFLIETIAAVRQVLGPELALGVRLSGGDFVPEGIDRDEAVAVARLVAATGNVDYINTSLGVATETLHMVEPSMATAPGYALPVSRAICDAVDIPVVGVGRFDHPAAADRALAEGLCDLVGVVRGQIADPDFVRKARSGGSRRIRTCLACNQECSGRVGFGLPLGCVVDPRVGAAGPVDLPAPGLPGRSVVVVGGGAAGLHAAIAAAELGNQVTLYERSDVLGGQLVAAARQPTRAQLMAPVTEAVSECRRLGVEIHTGTAVSADMVTGWSPDVVVIATGAKPNPPAWAVGLQAVVDVRDVLEHRVTPSGRVLVVDELGFHQGPGTAEYLADAGCSVTICTSAMVVAQDLGITLDMEGWRARADRKNISARTDTVVAGAAQRGNRTEVTLMHHPTGTEEAVVYDHVVTALHPEPEDGLWKALSSSEFNAIRIGDAVAPRRLDAAIREGLATFRTATFRKVGTDV